MFLTTSRQNLLPVTTYTASRAGDMGRQVLQIMGTPLTDWVTMYWPSWTHSDLRGQYSWGIPSPVRNSVLWPHGTRSA